MKPIVIATGNMDKFQQTIHILTSLGINPDSFLSLNDLNIVNDEPETGGVLDRAKQKALICVSKLSQKDRLKYHCVLANDVATILPTLNIETTESKRIAAEILAGKHIKRGDPMNYTYAYALILLPDGEMLTAQAEVPFVYLGNPDNLTLIQGQNTMSRVKAIPGQNVPHSHLPIQVETSHRVKYLAEALIPILERMRQL